MRRISKVLSTLIAGSVLSSAGALAADDLAAREQAARAAAGAFVQKLGGALKAELAKGGPDNAILVCRELAPQIAGEISRANGWQVTRVGTRVRNPMLGLPDGHPGVIADEHDGVERGVDPLHHRERLRRAADERGLRVQRLGRDVAHAAVRVVHDDLRPVPRGPVGEGGASGA